jgi:hypothetical protein
MQQSVFNNQKFADPKVPAKATNHVATAASAVQAMAKPSARDHELHSARIRRQ